MAIGGYYDEAYAPTPTSYSIRPRPNDKLKENSLRDYLYDVELVSLDPDYPVPPCLMSLNNFPIAAFGASGSVGDGNSTIK